MANYIIEEKTILRESEVIELVRGLYPEGKTLSRRDHQWRLLIALMYITGGRISEVLKLKKGNIQPHEKKKDYYVVTLRTLKRRKKMYRNVLLNIDRDKWVLDLLNSYFKEYPTNFLFSFYFNRKTEDGKIRLLSRQYGYFMVKRMTAGLNPHYFRHARATNLVKQFGFNDQELTFYMGWANSAMASVYVHLNLDVLTKKL